MRRLVDYASAIWTPMYAGAPAGHNNRVLLVRMACVLAAGSSAVIVALLGAGASRVPAIAVELGLLVVSFLSGLLIGRLTGRIRLTNPASPSNPLPPLTKAHPPS
jgi:hypothetical protein